MDAYEQKINNQRFLIDTQRAVIDKLEAEIIRRCNAHDGLVDILRIGCYCNRKEMIQWLEENKVVSDQPFEKEKTIVLRMFVIQQALEGEPK